MRKHLLVDYFGWGIALWFIGYLLGIILFMFVSPSILGWIIMPVGVVLTFFVLHKKVFGNSFQYYFYLAICWTIIAVVFDYVFVLKLLNPVDGYYKLDVYLYYALTFLIPVTVGYIKTARKSLS